jgi:hypothetical protein
MRSEDYISGRLQIPVQCSYFEYQDDRIRTLYDSFLEGLVVKCKYEKDEDQNYHIVFTPFAIVRSFEKKDLLGLFTLIFANTPYGEKLEERVNADDDYVWVNIFRSVVFALSLYVGQKFRLLLKACGINQSGYDWNLIVHNSDQSFIDAMKDLELSDSFMQSIADACGKTAASRNDITFSKGQNAYRASKAYEDICYLVRGTNKIADIETIEATLRDKYYFKKEDDLRRKTINLILIMLEISVLGNHINVTKDKVARAFRHGENSELLLSDDGMLSYVCAEVLYVAGRSDGFKKYYNDFYQMMNRYLTEKHYFVNGFSEDSFKKNMKDYENTPEEELHIKIMNKNFLLEHLDDQLGEVHNAAIEVVEQLMGGEQ